MSYTTLSSDMLPKSFVRPILEYGNLIWGPFYIQDQMQIEKAQRKANRWLLHSSDLPFTDRLSAYRHKRHDTIYLFQMMQRHVDIKISHLLTLAMYLYTYVHT